MRKSLIIVPRRLWISSKKRFIDKGMIYSWEIKVAPFCFSFPPFRWGRSGPNYIVNYEIFFLRKLFSLRSCFIYSMRNYSFYCELISSYVPSRAINGVLFYFFAYEVLSPCFGFLIVPGESKFLAGDGYVFFTISFLFIFRNW